MCLKYISTLNPIYVKIPQWTFKYDDELPEENILLNNITWLVLWMMLEQRDFKKVLLIEPADLQPNSHFIIYDWYWPSAFNKLTIWTYRWALKLNQASISYRAHTHVITHVT